MVNVAPLAPTLTAPENNGYRSITGYLDFAWVHNDPGDPQASASLRYKKQPGDAWTTLTDVQTTFTEYQLNFGVLLAPYLYEWQAQTKDSGGLWSPWSASRFFNTIAENPAPTMTAPSEGATVTASPLTVTWTLPIPGPVQDSYRILLLDASDFSVQWYDSGVVVGTEQSVTVDISAGAPEQIRVIAYAYSNGVFDGDTRNITNAVLPPETPLVVLAQTADKPEVVATIINPTATDANHADTVSVDVYRDGVPIAKTLPPNASYTDSLVGAGVVDYVVTARTALGGTAESY